MRGDIAHTLRCAALVLALATTVSAEESRADRDARAKLLPTPFLFLSGYSDGAGVKKEFTTRLDAFNAIGGITTDAELVRGLRARGKVFVHHAVNRPSTTAEEKVALWRAPFDNDLGGRLPGGFNVIAIDELHSNADGSEQAREVAKALRDLRSLYPRKLILTWSSWRLADGGPTTRHGKRETTYRELLGAVRETVDLFLLEVYVREANPQLDLFRSLSDNLAREAPDLLKKTVFGLYIPQRGFVADDSTKLGYWGFLDEQHHRIRNDPVMRVTPGIAYWVWYRSERETPRFCARLARHYFLDEGLTYFGDGDRRQLVANPQFDSGQTGWTLAAGDAGEIARFKYGNDTPPAHHDDHGLAAHGSHGLRTLRGATMSRATCDVVVRGGSVSIVSAYVTAMADDAGGARLSVATLSGKVLASKTLDRLPKKGWGRLFLRFEIPSDQRAVRLTLDDEGAAVGTILFWDFVELEEAYPASRLKAPRKPNG